MLVKGPPAQRRRDSQENFGNMMTNFVVNIAPADGLVP